jgi:moderate conductance mechanosensitive channel
MTLPADLWDRVLDFLRDPVLPSLLIAGIAAVLIRFTDDIVDGIFKTVVEREAGPSDDLSAIELRKRMTTLDSLVTAVIRGFILIIATLMILAELGIDIGPALAGLGIAGIAVGFGAQSLVKDYFNGALILLENQFSIGDIVTVAGTTGAVEDFSLRRTTLRDLDGILHTVPNSEIRVASNRTRVWAGINLDVTIAHGTDVDRATDVVNEVGRGLAEDPKWAPDVLETPRVLRVENIGEFGVTLKIVGKVRAPTLPAVNGELRRRLLAAFTANGIELPRPQRVVLAKDPLPDPFAPGGPTSATPGAAPSQDELSAGSE